MNRMPAVLFLALVAALALALAAVSLSVGTRNFSPGELRALLAGGGDETDRVIVMTMRLPRVIAAFLVGWTLASAGVAFQGLFRNPLADPFVAGTSGGGALGAVAAVALGWSRTFAGIHAISVAAFAGSVLSVFLVYALARMRGRVPVGNLILVGFAVGSFTSAMVSVVLFLTTRNWNDVIFWLLGSFAPATWASVRALFPYVAVPFVALCVLARPLNALALGEEQAVPLGVNVRRSTAAVLFAGALGVAAATALFGMIGFVGLIVPHLVRRIVGPDHRALLPCSAVAGGALLLACDLAARAALSPVGLPIGAVTALLGGPFFLFVIRRAQVRW